jgi:predicted nucleotidyltransferase
MAPIVTETCWPALLGKPRFGGVTDLSRYDDWLVWLRKQGRSDRAVRVVFIGGSAVTGGYDDHSDLDVEVLVTPGRAVAVYQRLLDAARRDFEVHALWELPEATWPDGRQAFLNLTPDAGDLSVPTRIIDLHVSDLADHHRLVDPRRHGEPMVLHDPAGLVELRPDDEDALERERREAVAQIAARRPTAAWLVNRAIARGQLAEAVAFHLQFAVSPLVRLLRIVNCPARHDFGLRYLDTDLPAGDTQRVEALLPGPELQARADAAFAWQDRLLADLAGPTSAVGS